MSINLSEFNRVFNLHCSGLQKGEQGKPVSLEEADAITQVGNWYKLGLSISGTNQKIAVDIQQAFEKYKFGALLGSSAAYLNLSEMIKCRQAGPFYTEEEREEKVREFCFRAIKIGDRRGWDCLVKYYQEENLESPSSYFQSMATGYKLLAEQANK